MNARRLTLTTLVSLCSLAGVALAGGAPASAQRVHVFSGVSFGAAGSGEGQFSGPDGVAVNEATGDVYVVDRRNNRVEYFSSAGVFLGQFNGSAAPTGALSEPRWIAVDNSTNPLDPSAGDVYVTDTGHQVIDKFSSTGAYVGQLTETSGGSHLEGLYGVAMDSSGLVWVYLYTHEIDSFSNALVNAFLSKRISPEGAGPARPGFAVDSEDNLYVNNGGEEAFFEKLNSSGARLILRVGSETSSAAAVDPTSNAVYIDNLSTVGEFSSTGAPLDRFGSGHLGNGSGVAVNASSELVYVADETADTVSVFNTILVADVSTGAVSAQVGGTATVGGVVNPDGVQVTSCVFEYGPTVAYGSSAPCVPSQGSGVAPVAVSGTLTGLQLGASYHYRLVAGNANGKNYGEDGVFVHGATVDDESVSDVASSSATLQAQIDPQGLPTTYRFEYGTSETYGSSIPVPDGIVGSGPTGVSVSAHPQELIASTTYHYRVAVSTAIGTSYGPDQTFTTQPAGGELALPDGRQWELVTPPNKAGARINHLPGDGLFQNDAMQAAADGSGIAYNINVPMELEPSGYSFAEEALSRRGAQGWSTRDISAPNETATRLCYAEYQFFSLDLSSALVSPACEEKSILLSSEASEPTPYVRHEALCDSPASASECYQPVLTGKEGFADVPPGSKFGGIVNSQGTGVIFEGASPDLSHVVLEANTGETGLPELVEWSANKPPSEALAPINVLPASEGGGIVEGEIAGSNPRWKGNRHSISDDGSRVVWGRGGTLYMRDTLRRETVRLGGGTFQIASSDGSKVFFTAGGLYECEIFEEAGKLACRLTDLTPETGGQSAGVAKSVLGASEDGSYVYFAADGVLGDGAQHGAVPGTCENASESTCNLYEYHDGEIKFIAMLSSGEDINDWDFGPTTGDNIGAMTARVSPDGRYVTFMSSRSLTGYDNRDALSGRPDEEVYLYDATAERLVCASCNPTGSRPSGRSERDFGGTAENIVGVIGTFGREGKDWIAANLPPSKDLYIQDESLYQPRALSDGGRVFFNSSDALVPQDVNGQEDVYEFEPVGKGSCASSSVTFSVKSDGCVSLISSGASPEESGFLDASVTGSDVFFLTSSRLTSQDYDTSYDIYDAHECTLAVPCVAPPVSPPPCSSGDSCKAAPSPQPPIFGSPASATFTGPGNVVVGGSPTSVVTSKSLTRAQKLAGALKACHRKAKRKRAGCEKQARRRYSAKGARTVGGTTRKIQG